MIRLLIWLAIIYLLYRTLRKWTRVGPTAGGPGFVPGSRNESDDLMVQDPYCGVYFLKKEGHHLHQGGKDLYFCSLECRDKYMGDHTDTRP